MLRRTRRSRTRRIIAAPPRVVIDEFADDEQLLKHIRYTQLPQQKSPRFTLKGFSGLALCEDVYDGDTAQFTFRAHNMPCAYRWTCRLARIEAAEIRTNNIDEAQLAMASRAALQGYILHRIVWLDVTDRHGQVWPSNCRGVQVQHENT